MADWASDSDFLETFRAEAEERIKNLSEGLLALEGSARDEDLVKRLFREAHTLKGSAGMMGLTSIKDLAHRVEDILSAVQKGQISIDAGLVDVILESLDRMEELLPAREPGCGVTDADVDKLVQRLGDIAKGEPGAGDKAGSETSAENQGDNELASAPPADGESREEVRPPAEGHSSSGASLPPGRTESGIAVVTPPGTASGGAPARPAGGSKPAAKADPTIRVHIERLDKILNLMGEIIVNQIDAEGQARDLAALKGKANRMNAMFKSLVSQVEQLKTDAGEERIAALSQQVAKAGEGARDLAAGLERTATHLGENAAGRRLALDELQERTLNVRMLPISTIFDTFPRVVRDASRASGKEVRLEMSGGETELDKRILEQVADPLMHILRNCVDHGIELPEERRRAGKPEAGKVALAVSQQGDRVEILVSDDGAGIDPRRVKEVACRKGLIAGDAEPTFDEILEMIFRPGFSTSPEVSEISGRGVGLDVVKNNLERLDGSMTVESNQGEGTTFLVSLPVTLAVIAGLLVQSNGKQMVLPLGFVQEMVAIEEDDVQTLGNHRAFLMRGEAIPLVDLLDLLGGGPSASPGGKVQVVIVSRGRHPVGLEVSGLITQQEVVIKSPGEFLAGLPFVAGMTVMGDGEPVVVVNVNEVINRVRRGIRRVETGEATASPAQEEEKHLVLVVEDSLVVRELQRNILEAAGYAVDIAVDGEDALAHLGQQPVDCVVTDLEMPRMNGFDLTAAIRHSEEYRDIPVVMVTSRGSEEDKQHGIDVGADAYVIKGTFDQQTLLNTINRLVA